MNTVNSFNKQRGCPYCLNIGMTKEWQFIHAWQFFPIQITSLSSRCIPLKNFEIQLASRIVKKYQLGCIIQRSGNSANIGHYWSNMKNSTWYLSDDANISVSTDDGAVIVSQLVSS